MTPNLTAANNEHLRERQNMQEAANHSTPSGEWRVVATLPSGRKSVAVGNIDSEAEANKIRASLKESETAGFSNSDLTVTKN